MSIASDFQTAMAAHAPLVALVGSRISENAADGGWPAVVYQVNEEKTRGLDGSVLAVKASILVEAWAKGSAAAASVAQAVSAALAGAPAAAVPCVLDESDAFDPDRALDGKLITIEWWG